MQFSTACISSSWLDVSWFRQQRNVAHMFCLPSRLSSRNTNTLLMSSFPLLANTDTHKGFHVKQEKLNAKKSQKHVLELREGVNLCNFLKAFFYRFTMIFAAAYKFDCFNLLRREIRP